jgi:hypothetical protein
MLPTAERMMFPLLEAKAFERVPKNDLRPNSIPPVSRSNSENHINSSMDFDD